VLERSGVEVVAAVRSRPLPGALALDVSDAAAVERTFVTTKPDVAFLAVNVPGGVDRCEDHPDDAYDVNVAGTRHVAAAAAELGRQLARAMTLDAGLILPVPTSELGQRAARPLGGGLKTDRLAALLGTPPLDLAESLKRFRRGWRADTHTSDAPKAGARAAT